MADYVCFSMGLAFISQNTVIPAFMRQLTDSPLLIGLNGTIQTVGWLLPQIVAANYLSGKTQKKPYLLVPSAIGRPVFFLLAVALVLGIAQQHPGLMLAIVLLGLALFRITDALAAVAWFDILGNVFPPKRRGRLFGLGQVLSGVLTVGAGFAINYVLGSAGPPFPYNYALLFLVAGLLFGLAWIAEALIKEPQQVAPADDGPRQTFLRRLTHIWQSDRDFRLFIVVRLLAGLSNLAIPFYVIFATDQLGLGEGTVGSFTSAQVIGSMAGAVILGTLYERRGGKRTIQVGVGAGALAPLWALMLPFLLPAEHPWLVYGYSLVFVALGVVQSNFMQGFFNYLLDLASADERATYVALSNAINGVVLSPTAFIGGIILKITNNSYPTLFFVTAIGVGTGLLCTTRMAERR